MGKQQEINRQIYLLIKTGGFLVSVSKTRTDKGYDYRLCLGAKQSLVVFYKTESEDVVVMYFGKIMKTYIIGQSKDIPSAFFLARDIVAQL